MGDNRFCRITLLVFILFIFFPGCFNPFFPKTDVPLSGTYLTSLDGVIRQLVKSYESNRLDLFKDLFDNQQQFRFYIQSTTAIDTTLHHIPTTRKVYLKEDYIPIGNYMYLDYSEEMRVHTNLLATDNEIIFTTALRILKKDYIIIVTDTATDTIAGIIHTDKAKITITSEVLLKALGKRTVEFPIGEQVFYCQRDQNNLWRIKFWYELN